jgi:hypothetical protein
VGASSSEDQPFFRKSPNPLQAQGGTCCSSPWRAHCTLCAICASLQVHNHLVLVLHHSALKWVPEQCSPRTRANPSRQQLLGRCKKEEKEKSPNSMQSQAHAAVRPGGLTARCVQSVLDLQALQALARSVALPSLCGMGGLRGWGSWRAPEFWAGKSCTFRKSRKDFQNKHVHPPPTTSPVRKNWTVDFHAISRKRCLC